MTTFVKRESEQKNLKKCQFLRCKQRYIDNCLKIKYCYQYSI